MKVGLHFFLDEPRGRSKLGSRWLVRRLIKEEEVGRKKQMKNNNQELKRE